MQVNGIPYEQWKQQKAKPKVEFIPDIWNMVKEFAGIYNIGTQWGIVSKLSGQKLRDFYRSLDVTEAKTIRKGLHGLRKFKTLNAWKRLYLVANGVDLSKYVYGDVVHIKLRSGWRTKLQYTGTIVKITKKTIRIVEVCETPFSETHHIFRSISILNITKV